MADNSITIVGNLTRDPELRFTNSGVARAILGVAVNHRFLDRTTNEWQERPSFFNAVCWRDLAQNVSDTLSLGDRVVITGRLEQRSWETDQGDKRSIIEIVVDEIGPSLRWATAELTRTSGSSAGRPVGRVGQADSAVPTEGREANQTSGAGEAPADAQASAGEEPF